MKILIIHKYLFRGVEEEWEDETVETVIASNTSINQVCLMKHVIVNTHSFHISFAEFVLLNYFSPLTISPY